MNIVSTIADVKAFMQSQKKTGKTVGFVPTMGALHQGHMSLVQSCKKDNDITALSIYVNPTQFGPQEDLGSYFRPIKEDTQMAASYGVDLLFLPTDETMYGRHASTYVVEKSLSKVLCGKFRPGHFDGVTTIVLKLLNILNPDRLYLGLKDAQQYRIIEKMAEDLFLPVQVKGVPIIREDDGLACSSRNGYLNPSERAIAPTLFKALQAAQEIFKAGQTDTSALIQIAKDVISKQSEFSIQYLELLEWESFTMRPRANKKSLLALACFLGKTRLIDNTILLP